MKYHLKAAYELCSGYDDVAAAAALHNLKALNPLKQDLSVTEEVRAEQKAVLALALEPEIAKRNLNGLTTPTEACPKAVEAIPPRTR